MRWAIVKIVLSANSLKIEDGVNGRTLTWERDVLFDCLADKLIGGHVDRCGCLIKENNLGLFKDCSCHAELIIRS